MQTPNPTIVSAAMRLTHAFEGGTGGGLSGNFDAQTASWGPLQWNLGQGTLQPVLARIVALNRAATAAVMGEEFCAVCSGPSAAVRPWFQRSVLTRGGTPLPQWQARFIRLSDTPAAQQAFRERAQSYINGARILCETLGFTTARAFALCFDISVQNGAPRSDHLGEYRHRRGDAPGLQEYERLKILANVVADLAAAKWHDDVLSRKLTCALGSSAASRLTVHGKAYDLDAYGLSYALPWALG